MIRRVDALCFLDKLLLLSLVAELFQMLHNLVAQVLPRRGRCRRWGASACDCDEIRPEVEAVDSRDGKERGGDLEDETRDATSRGGALRDGIPWQRRRPGAEAERALSSASLQSIR